MALGAALNRFGKDEFVDDSNRKHNASASIVLCKSRILINICFITMSTGWVIGWQMQLDPFKLIHSECVSIILLRRFGIWRSTNQMNWLDLLLSVVASCSLLQLRPLNIAISIVLLKQVKGKNKRAANIIWTSFSSGWLLWIDSAEECSVEESINHYVCARKKNSVSLCEMACFSSGRVTRPTDLKIVSSTHWQSLKLHWIQR